MRTKTWSILLVLAMLAGMITDTNAQSRRARIKAKFKKTFGTPPRPHRPSRATVVAPPAPPRPPRPHRPPAPPVPPPPPRPPLPR